MWNDLINLILSRHPFLQQEYYGNSLLAYGLSVVVFFLVFVFLGLIKKFVINRLHRLSDKTQNDFDDLIVHVLQGIGWPLYFLISFGIAVQTLSRPEVLGTVGKYLTIFVLVYTAVRALQKIVHYFFDRAVKKRLLEDPRFDPSAIRVLSKLISGLVWVIALLVIIQNEPFNFDITALVAGLGIGGIAIAFALQNVLSDVFASISIYFDKPFKTGDFIIVGENLGTVRHIGLKSTRIESLWGEEVVIPNKELTETRVRNYKRMERRRIAFEFGILYETSPSKVQAIPGMIKDVFQSVEQATLDRAHFKNFGDSSLEFEVVYYVESSDYNLYMDIQQAVNLAMMEVFDKENIVFAYPTQTVYVQNVKSK